VTACMCLAACLRTASANDLLVSIARLPRSDLKPQDASLHRALALDLGLGEFDPLTRDLAADFNGPRPRILLEISAAAWRNIGGRGRAHRVCLRFNWFPARRPSDPAWIRTNDVLDWIKAKLRPVIDACGAAEISAFLRGLDGRFIQPGPSVHRRGDGLTYCRPVVIFSRSDVRAVPNAFGVADRPTCG